MDYLSPDEVAARFRIAPATVRRWCRLGLLKSLRVGRQYRILESDVEAFLKSQEVREEPKKIDGLVAFAN